jgi:hypothetical protein
MPNTDRLASIRRINRLCRAAALSCARAFTRPIAPSTGELIAVVLYILAIMLVLAIGRAA